MTNKDTLYEIRAVGGDNSLTFIFVSKGLTDIVKAVAYDYVQEFMGTSLFNLGFGDYNLETLQIDDTSNSNNGDVYRVFNTVLSTVPIFFTKFPDATMVVGGSDQGQDFAMQCLKSCNKNCEGTCKKINRRIQAYRYFVRKNYDVLVNDYYFFGGFRVIEGILLDNVYDPDAEYDLVFCKKS